MEYRKIKFFDAYGNKVSAKRFYNHIIQGKTVKGYMLHKSCSFDYNGFYEKITLVAPDLSVWGHIKIEYDRKDVEDL